MKRRITAITAALALAGAAAIWLLATGRGPAAPEGERGGAFGEVPAPVGEGTLAGAPGARAPTERGQDAEAESAEATEPEPRPCTVHLRGRVRDPSGAVPADAWVFAAADDGGFENRWSVFARAPVALDGTYALQFAAPRERLLPTSVGLAGPGRVTVQTLVGLPTCADGASECMLEVDLAFPTGKRIRGTLTDADGLGMPGLAFLWFAESGQVGSTALADPRNDAQAWLGQGAAPLVVTDREGRFEVEGDLEMSPSPAPASLDAGWTLEVESIAMSGAAGSESEEVRVVARPAGGIDFRVVAGGAGTRVEEGDVVVVARCEGKVLCQGAWTLKAGRARVVFVWPAGARGPAQVDFLVEAPWCDPHRETVTCSRGEGVKRVDVRLDPVGPRPRTVAIREEEVVGLCLRYHCEIQRIATLGDARIGRPVSKHAVSDGALEIALPPGRHEIELHPSLPFAEHVPWVLTIDVPAEGEARTSVVRPTHGSLRIVDPGLEPGWNRPASLSLRDAVGAWVPGGYDHTVTLRAGGRVLPYFPVGDWTLVETYDSGFTREYPVHVTAGAETVVTLRHR